MRMENEGPAGRTRPQIRREAALRRAGGLAGERSSGRCWNLLMHHWSHGACDTWQKHAPLHHDVAQPDVCGHPT